MTAIQSGARVGPRTASTVTFTVNGTEHRHELDHRTSLLDALRERLGLAGSKKGCDHGQCGACTVLLDGRRVNSCLVLAVTVQGREVTTVEGLGEDGCLHPVQETFVEADALQCGYCTPGQVCSAVGMLREAAAGWPSAVTDPASDGLAGADDLDAAEVAERMSGNLCRCGAYANIVPAVLEAARRSAAASASGSAEPRERAGGGSAEAREGGSTGPREVGVGDEARRSSGPFGERCEGGAA